MTRGKVTVVLDSQAGSCGKGKFVGYLAIKDNIDAAMNNFMTNAGHTWVSNDDSRSVMTQHLPTSLVNPKTVLMIGPGAAITPSTLFTELVKFRDLIGERQVIVNPRAMVIRPMHMQKEKEIVRSGSTFKGCGIAQADKIMRVPGTMLFGDFFTNHDWSATINEMTNEPFTKEDIIYLNDVLDIEDTMDIVNDMIDDGYNMIVEGSQGCDLDLNYGIKYPNCTSRQCHAGQLVADCGISPRLVNDIVMIMRPYPIRISNKTNIGIEVSSGDYGDADEITWDIVKERCGAPADTELAEITTVTKKTRRVFEMNWDRLRYVTKLNRPTQIALNFVQYLDYDALHCRKWKELPDKVKDFINKVQGETNVPVTLIGTGANNADIIDVR